MKTPHKIVRCLFVTILACTFGSASGCARGDEAAPSDRILSAVDEETFRQAALLGRGINLGNALDAPKEGEWGMTIKDEYFPIIRDAGFDSVRIPIRWSAHADISAPYTIDAEFFERVDHVIDQALAADLAVVINVHHYEQIHSAPGEHITRFLRLWVQIADRYQNLPEKVYFELLNEPYNKLNAKRWNDLLVPALKTVRANNPNRLVIIGPARWNNINALKELELPEDDRRLISTVHYYEPFQFTHQQAPWVDGADKWKDREWTGSPREIKTLRNDFEKVHRWSRQHGRPIYLGEFGAYSKADMPSRARWNQAVRETAEGNGFSWSYWEFASGFGAYDPEKEAWREPLLKALVPK
ncbi:glycoside hydrolase family 5 protein [Calycomorphotria hydatis]|uniref:Endoglucanase H n=1 Tax=Calycomorphotria hydatis TaxID=2528027 RepID=A0A517TDY5_9PLAN|nr:glycoside hydrolase family 5 protein [Calycomorphotria hydatis]QDT66584.1 Endoglucanase H precursor [Calycomorphotria hydatis]